MLVETRVPGLFFAPFWPFGLDCRSDRCDHKNYFIDFGTHGGARFLGKKHQYMAFSGVKTTIFSKIGRKNDENHLQNWHPHRLLKLALETDII